MHTSVRYVVFAVLLTLAMPLSASAATLTVTQQGIVSASAPKGAQRAVFLETSITAGCDGDVVVTSMTVKHRGLGDSADLARVYATEGDVRLSRTRSLDSSDRSATLQFIPSMNIRSCTTKHVQIRGDFSAEAAAAGEHGLLIEAVDAGDAVVTLASTTKPKTITTRPVSSGTVNVEFLSLTKALQFGKNRTFARLRLEADNVTNHDLVSITLTNDGKATDADLQNLRLVNRKGEAVTTTAATMTGNRVTLTFDPLLRLNRNDLILLELKGDITESKKRTIRFTLEEPADLEAVSRAR